MCVCVCRSCNSSLRAISSPFLAGSREKSRESRVILRLSSHAINGELDRRLLRVTRTLTLTFLVDARVDALAN